MAVKLGAEGTDGGGPSQDMADLHADFADILADISADGATTKVVLVTTSADGTPLDVLDVTELTAPRETAPPAVAPPISLDLEKRLTPDPSEDPVAYPDAAPAQTTEEAVWMPDPVSVPEQDAVVMQPAPPVEQPVDTPLPAAAVADIQADVAELAATAQELGALAETLVDDTAAQQVRTEGLRAATAQDVQEQTTIHGSVWNDRLRGMEGDDLLRGLMGRDLIEAGQGDDSLVGGTGNDTLVGGGGRDTAIVLGRMSDYALTVGQSGETYLTHEPTGEVDALVGIEVVEFLDDTVAMDELAAKLPVKTV